MPDVHIRPLTADETHLFTAYTGADTRVGRRSATYDHELARGHYRPEWTWIAEEPDGRVVARAAFFAPPDAAHPWTLDALDHVASPAGIGVGTALLHAAYGALVGDDWHVDHDPHATRPDYHLFLPADWREDPADCAEADARGDAAVAFGLVRSHERVNLRWTPDDGLPPRTTRLTFDPADDDTEVLAVLTACAEGSLDHEDQQAIAQGGPAQAARDTLDAIASFPGGRDRWRIARAADGTVVGIVMGTRNPNAATIGYLGVVPTQRGRGYAADLVAEALHVFAEHDDGVVTDATDAPNTPMQAALVTNGYQVTGRRIVFT